MDESNQAADAYYNGQDGQDDELDLSFLDDETTTEDPASK